MERNRLTALLESLAVSPDLEGQLRALLETTMPVEQVDAALAGRAVLRGGHAARSGPTLPARYEGRGLLGTGGMGEVHLVWDRILEREVALKVVRLDLALSHGIGDRFVAEARATAALAHPGIVPVYDHGFVDDGRPYFTMQVVRGETVKELIRRLHAEPGDRRLPFRRLVDVLERVAGAVGYAHARGVVHRDLKPANLLVGEHGEVRVVDWGLFRADPSWDGPPALVAAVAGTPAYMAPEQARGDGDRIDARTDVYGLGVILWEMVAGRAPFAEIKLADVLQRLVRGEVPGPPPARIPLPTELAELIDRCLQADPAGRPADGQTVANALRRWLDGETRRDRAGAELEIARARAEEMGPRREAAREARGRADALLAATRSWEPDTTREAWWAADDEATALERACRATERAIDDALEAALVHDPEDVQAHAAAAERARAAHAAAEQSGDPDVVAVAEHRLLRHATALPEDHPQRRAAMRWLTGDGALTLHSDPPGATVTLHRYELVRRRRVPVESRVLGRTPLDAVPLPHGPWLLTLHHEDRPVVRYPVRIGREEHWHGVPPGGSDPLPIVIPAAGELGVDDCYLPAGWARVGGDPDAPGGLPALRVWVDGCVMRRYPVTNAEYLAFVNDLAARAGLAAAERYAPRDRGHSATGWGEVLYGRDGDRFALRADAEGEVWQPDWPILMVDHVAAWAFARWEAARLGRPWRLPGELEWEKAARAGDGRIFPWGDQFDPSWCAVRPAFRGAPKVEAVQARPLDESVYGVRGLAGNIVELTADRLSPLGSTEDGGRVRVPDGSADGEDAWLDRTASHRIASRGGSRMHDAKAARSAFRLAVDPWARGANLGFRLARPL